MLKTIGIILAVYCFAFGAAKNAPDGYKLSYPKFVPAFSTFDISFITSNNFHDAEKLEIYIIPDSKVSLNKIELRSLYKNKNLNFVPVSLPDAPSQAYKATIPLFDTAIAPGIFFQVLLGFKSESASSSVIKLMGIYKTGDKIIGRINSGAGNGFDNKYITVNLNFYKPQKNAGNSLWFTRNSQLKISLQQTNSQNLLTEFWIKASGNQTKFLELKNTERHDFSYSFSTNPFQMLIVKRDGRLIDNLNPVFISKKDWYHVSIILSFIKNSADFYCNGLFLGKTQLPPFTNPDDIIFIFGDQTTDNSFQIDLLRFINLGNSVDVSFSNRNFLNFVSDSSSVIYQFSFDKNDQLNAENDKIKISSSNMQYVHSDAPIFARAPELNISLFNNSYNLKWSGGDIKQARYYVLQKTSKNSEYQDVYQLTADNNPETEYSFIDNRDESSDIVYYRVKQVNSDGSVVYSSQVKIGQGAQEPFVIRQNYPNPFNPKTSIVVELLKGSQVNIIVYNLEGKEIAKIYNGFLAEGVHTFSFDGTELPSGVYIYKIATPNYSETKKMILTK